MEDKIGQLNEDIIGVIISYLTLKEARRTSVLSRRWKNMWTLTTRLCFDSVKQEEYKRVMSKRSEYISRVNEHVDNHRGTNLDEFVVVFPLDARHSLDLDKWISFALKRRAKAIKINLYSRFAKEKGSERYSLMKNVADLPGIECLSSLCLTKVNVSGETIEHLLSVCPLLERLSLSFIDSEENLMNLRVVGPSLKLRHLTIYLDHRFASIEICAPNLLSFDYLATGATRVRLEGLCSLHDLRVCSWSLIEFFRYFPQLETLNLTMDINYRVFGHQLINLKHLTLTIFYDNEDDDMSGLTNLINCCPLLRKFTLEMIDLLFEEQKTPTLTWGKLLPHEYLKVVEMIGFIGHRLQIEITKYLLESLNSLEKFIINTHCKYNLVHEETPVLREKAEELKSEVRSGVELLIL